MEKILENPSLVLIITGFVLFVLTRGQKFGIAPAKMEISLEKSSKTNIWEVIPYILSIVMMIAGFIGFLPSIFSQPETNLQNTADTSNQSANILQPTNPMDLQPTSQQTIPTIITSQLTPPFNNMTPEPTIPPLEISSNNNIGYTFNCPVSGRYEIKYVGGAYSVDDERKYWRTVILIFVDEEIQWGTNSSGQVCSYDDGNQPCPRNLAINPFEVLDFVGNFRPLETENRALTEPAQKSSLQVSCNNVILLISMDDKNSYHNNNGSVTIQIQKIN